MLARRFPLVLLISLAVTTLLAGGSALAIPFDSLNGNFTFTNLTITGTPDAVANASVAPTTNGFDIIITNDGMRVGPDDARDIVVQYQVSSNAGPIITAALSFEAQALGLGAVATVSEDYFSEPGGSLILPGLTVFTTPSGSLFSDSQSVGGQLTMSVKKDILVTAFGGQLAEITRVSQDYSFNGGGSAIPEPSAGLLFTAGGLLVASQIRRQRRPAR